MFLNTLFIFIISKTKIVKNRSISVADESFGMVIIDFKDDAIYNTPTHKEISASPVLVIS